MGKARWFIAPMALALAAAPGFAQPRQSGEAAPWLGTFLLGGSLWPGLREVALPPKGYEALELGRFHTTGGNLELGLYRRLRRTSDGELQVGGEFGVWWHESASRRTFTDFSQRMTIQGQAAANGGHLTGSVRHVWGRGRVTPFLGLGAGWYLLVFKETFGSVVSDTDARANAFGGFLTAGLEVRGASPFAFRSDAQVHVLSFGGAALRGQRVAGPVYTLRIGGSMRF